MQKINCRKVLKKIIKCEEFKLNCGELKYGKLIYLNGYFVKLSSYLQVDFTYRKLFLSSSVAIYHQGSQFLCFCANPVISTFKQIRIVEAGTDFLLVIQTTIK